MSSLFKNFKPFSSKKNNKSNLKTKSAVSSDPSDLLDDIYGFGSGGKKFGPVPEGKTRILITGERKAGKKAFAKLVQDQLETTATENIQSLGFSSSKIDFVTKSMADREYGGRMSRMAVWKHYVPNIAGIILLVDSSARDELLGNVYNNEIWNSVESNLRHQLAQLDYNKVAPVLVYANKKDLENCLNLEEMKRALNLDKLKDSTHPLHIQPLNALTGEGLFEGMEWLAQQLNLEKLAVVEPNAQQETTTSQEEGAQIANNNQFDKENEVVEVPVEKSSRGNSYKNSLERELSLKELFEKQEPIAADKKAAKKGLFQSAIKLLF